MDKEYILSFASFYKAAYGRDILMQEGINGTLRKLPPEIVASCTTGLYLRNVSIGLVKKILADKGVKTRGIFLVQVTRQGKREYVKI